MSNNQFFSLEVFPKMGSNYAQVTGSIEFSFNGEKYYLVGQNEAVSLNITNGTSSSGGPTNYHAFRLYTPKENAETDPFSKAEVICDIVSMSTRNHMRYFSPLFNEYYINAGWSGTGDLEMSNTTNKIIDHWGEYNFIDYNLLIRLLSKLEKSKDKNKLLAAFHLNRLAKYKAFSHITEALADCVSSLEALYMEENGNRQDNFDKKIPKGEIKKTIKKGGSLKGAVLMWFIRKYYTGDLRRISEVDDFNVYKIRSAYLHRGFIKEPPGNMNVTSLDRLDDLDYNAFFEVAYNTMLNFALS